MSENQVKSKQRVIDHGEVFTAEREVNAMLDLVKQETERIDSRFLEPACGDGNFLAEILRRKLAVVKRIYRKSPIDYEKNAVLAATSIYGVDIMEEAVEICKLRLFLKLIAQVEKTQDVETLPDIDFNIRSGNTFVGFTSIDEVKTALQMNLNGQYTSLLESEEVNSHLLRIEEEANLAHRAYLQFQDQQLDKDIVTSQDKTALQKKLLQLNNELNRALAKTYGVNENSLEYSTWLENHKPFNWLADFFGIMQTGGFDVIIGNPPYVEYAKIKNEYSIRNYRTESCGNLYAFVSERSMRIKKINGRISFITPISLICTQRMKPIQDILFSEKKTSWISNFSERPSKLFSGAEVLITIFIVGNADKEVVNHFGTGFIKWASIERPYLFERILYNKIIDKPKNCVIPKISSDLENNILTKVYSNSKKLGSFYSGKNNSIVYYRIGGGRYWKIFTNFKPAFILKGIQSTSSRENHLYFHNSEQRNSAVCLLSSSLFYWFFILTTNCRDLNPSDLSEFPIDLGRILPLIQVKLDILCAQLMKDYQSNSKQKIKTSSITGKISYQEFYPKYSKSLIDEIDCLIAKHYGFSDEELDFIKNYDIKYRMGADTDEE